MKHHTTPAGEQTATVPQPAAYSPPPATSVPAEKIPWDIGDPPTTVEATTEPTPADEIKTGDAPFTRVVPAAAHTSATWLGLYRTPPSLRDAWEMSSSMSRSRVPAESGLLGNLWWILNRSERLILFAVTAVLLVPVSVLLYCACRPTRRVGLYAVILLVFVVIPWMLGG